MINVLIDASVVRAYLYGICRGKPIKDLYHGSAIIVEGLCLALPLQVNSISKILRSLDKCVSLPT